MFHVQHHRDQIDTRPFFRCTVNLERVLTTLEDQELKENVEVMRNLQEVILELKVSIYLHIRLRKIYNVIINHDSYQRIKTKTYTTEQACNLWLKFNW